MIPLSVPNLKGNELKYVTDAVEQEWVSTGGSYIELFEERIANYLNVEKAVACQSGTAGLHLAMELSGVERDTEVIVPTLTFIAAVNPVKYLGADPVFMDCDDTLNMDLDKLEKFCKTECHLTDEGLLNKKSNKLIKALVIVHVFGNMIDMEKAVQIAQKYKLKLIEDATEALGTYYINGEYNGRYAGTIGDFGVYSFNGNKIITTGGGGMLVAKDVKLADRAKYLSTQAKDDQINFHHNEVGYNYRMTNLQAAIGVAQLEQLESFIAVKKHNYDLYKAEVEKIDGLSLIEFNSGIRPNYWFYSLKVDKERYGISRETLLERFSKEKVQTRPIWGLIHEQKPYLANQSYQIVKASQYRDVILNIPCSTNLTTEQVMEVVGLLQKFKS